VTRLAVIAGFAVLLAGCSAPDTLLLDDRSGTTGRAHCSVVADPFGGKGQVIFGEVVEKQHNKTSFFNTNGFFVVPPEWAGAVVLRYAVRKERHIRVVLVSETGKLKSFHFDAPALETWCEQRLELRRVSGRIRPGEKIVDISIWQQGGGKAAGLWVDRVGLSRK